MKKYLLIISTLVLITVTTRAQDDESTLTRPGQEAPSFSCMTVDGTVIDIKELKGKVIWINFFATWCPPCKKELPVLEKNVMERYRDNPDFVLVVLGREHSMDEMKEYAVSTGLELPFAPDKEREIFSMFATQSIPRNVIIGRDGKIAVQSIGYTESEFTQLEKKLASLLEE
ncbi:MAG TPA: TlpA family protein disulfide reductase [Bacteroidetes bacterium]|nr:TlpA family protein disulfide reductase [Bacteroidota bacterium]